MIKLWGVDYWMMVLKCSDASALCCWPVMSFSTWSALKSEIPVWQYLFVKKVWTLIQLFSSVMCALMRSCIFQKHFLYILYTNTHTNKPVLWRMSQYCIWNSPCCCVKVLCCLSQNIPALWFSKCEAWSSPKWNGAYFNEKNLQIVTLIIIIIWYISWSITWVTITWVAGQCWGAHWSLKELACSSLLSNSWCRFFF